MTNINPRCKKAFEKYLEELNKPNTFTSNYHYQYKYFNQSLSQKDTDFCMIYFYEWSNLMLGAKPFRSKNEFFKMLENCKIHISESQKKTIEELKSKALFTTCTPNKPHLMTSDSWYNLKKIVEAYEKTNNNQ